MKKIISFLLVLTIVFSTFNFAYADTDTSLTNNIDRILSSLGIIIGNNGPIDDSAEVTRAELVMVLSRLVNFDKNYEVNDIGQVFEDVSGTHWAAQEIKYVTDCGFMSVYNDGKFYPSDAVSYEEMVMGFVKVTGYDVLAKIKGATVNSYIAAAAEAGLLNGIERSEYVTRAQMMRMTYNAISIDYMYTRGENTLLGTDYTTYEGYSVLSKYKNIFKEKGVVEATHITSLESGRYGIAAKGHVIIDGKSYAIGETDAEFYLGQDVEYYYQNDEENAVNTLVCIVPTNKTTVLSIYAENINNSKITTKLDVYAYYDENGKNKTVNMDDPAVIYNGVAKPGYRLAEITPDSGMVKLIDNDGDGDYDVIDIFDVTECIIVDTVNEENDGYAITYLDNKSKYYFVKNTGSEERFRITEDENEISIMSLESGDVLLIGENKESDYRVLRVSALSVTGTVTKKDSEYIYVDEMPLKYSALYLKKHELTDIDIGEYGTFYIDCFGEVQAFIKDRTDSLAYAMVLDVGQKVGLASVYSVKILDTKSEISIYQLEDKVKLNQKTATSKKAYETLSTYTSGLDGFRDDFNSSHSKRQLIMYKLNDKGKISELNTVISNSEYDIENPLSFADKVTYITNKYTWYNAAISSSYGMSIGGKYYATKTTYIFHLLSEDEDCYVTQASIGNSAYFPNLYIYNAKEDRTSDVIIASGTDSATKPNQLATYSVMCFSDFSTAIDNEENEILVINGYRGGEKVEVEVLNDKSWAPEVQTMLDTMVSGDVIMYNVSENGKLNGLARAFAYDLKGTYGVSRNVPKDGYVNGNADLNNQHSNSRFIYGKVEKVVGTYILYSLGGEETYVHNVINVPAVTLMTFKGNELVAESLGGPEEILPDKDVVIVGGRSKNIEVFVFN